MVLVLQEEEHSDGRTVVLVLLLLDTCIEKLKAFLKTRLFSFHMNKAQRTKKINAIFVDYYVRACRYADSEDTSLLDRIPRFENLLYDDFPARVKAVVDSGFHAAFLDEHVMSFGGVKCHDRFDKKHRYGVECSF